MIRIIFCTPYFWEKQTTFKKSKNLFHRLTSISFEVFSYSCKIGIITLRDLWICWPKFYFPDGFFTWIISFDCSVYDRRGKNEGNKNGSHFAHSVPRMIILRFLQTIKIPRFSGSGNWSVTSAIPVSVAVTGSTVQPPTLCILCTVSSKF